MKSKTPASPTPPSPESAEKAEPTFGWNVYAEQINGRFAMVGFVAILLLEFFTGENFFTWLGLG
ncbi:MAG: chlorophyll a/b-binding protein [Microcoleus sp.]